MHYKAKKKNKVLSSLLAVFMGVCLCVLLTAWGSLLTEPQASALAPDHAPSEADPNQTPMAESVSSSSIASGEEDEEKDDDGGGIDLSYREKVNISIQNKTVDLYFGTGIESSADIILQVVVGDQVLAQSGKLIPGNEIKTLTLLEGVETSLNEGSYEGKMMLYCYSLDTGEKLPIVSVLPVTVIVQS